MTPREAFTFAATLRLNLKAKDVQGKVSFLKKMNLQNLIFFL